MSQTTEEATEAEESENEFEFTIVCDETGEEFESMDEFETHRTEQMRERKIEEAREFISENYDLDVEALEELHGEDFETLVDEAVAWGELFNSYEGTPARLLAGSLFSYVGWKLMNHDPTAEDTEEESEK